MEKFNRDDFAHELNKIRSAGEKGVAMKLQKKVEETDGYKEAETEHKKIFMICNRKN